MALIAPGICRFSILGLLQGQQIVNVFDFQIDTTGDIVSRSDAIWGLAGDILNNWTDEVFPALSAEYSATEVRWVDLNSATGETGSRSSTDANTWPMPGDVTGGVLPNNVCALLVKRLEGKNRQARNGLTRLAGIPEAFTVPSAGNNLTGDAVTGYTNAMNTFLADTNDVEGPVDGPTRKMVVVHTVEQAYVGYSDVESFQAKSVVGTIRRRMPGYGD